jgi:type II secretory pathway pseudopilin PulG
VVNSYTKRFAFSMIELIFAIVIIGISVASLPIMTNAIGKGVENNLVQEAIFAAATQINQVLSYRWDENSVDESIDANATGLAKVIDTQGDCVNDSSNPRFRLRPGHIAQPFHRRCLDSNSTTVSTTFGKEVTGETNDDIDDNIVTNQDLFINTASADAYKNSYTYDISIIPSSINGNYAKKVEVAIQNSDGENITNLTSYTFNIGEIDYYKRVYP